MDLQISAFLLFSLFTAGHSLSCYQCWNDTGSCVDHNVTCSSGYSCVSVTTVWKVGETKVNSKYCADYCASGSMNYGFVQVSYSCCDTDLCNVHNPPDPSTNTPNGKMCYYCVGQNCSNTVRCSGSEDRCFTQEITGNKTLILKGCISKSICDYVTETFSNVNGSSCCEGNLCNGVYNVTQNITQNINITHNITQNINITHNITQNVPQGVTQSTNSAKSVTQSFLLLLIVYLIK